MDVFSFHDARREDTDAIAALHVAAWQETYSGLLPQEMLDSLDLAQRRIQWQNVLAHKASLPAGGVVLAWQQSRLCGFVSYGPQRDQGLSAKGYLGEIDALYLAGWAKGKGLGRKLFQKASERLSASGIGSLALWVLAANAPACAFYAAMGGEICDRRVELRPEATLQDRAYGWSDLPPADLERRMAAQSLTAP